MDSPENAVPGGTETILLVDPDAATRALAVFMLSRRGYRVLEARNAAEAISQYEQHDGEIDLLFTEAVMSRVNGHDLALRLTERNPQLPVLYLSDRGYERLARQAALKKKLMFLCRPFTMRTLAEKVRQVLDGARTRTFSASQ